MVVVDAIASVQTDTSDKPLTPVVIKTIIIDDDVELPEPNKIID